MLNKYIAWTVRGKKHGTTRMHRKPLGVYEVVHRKASGDTVRYGLLVKIYKVKRWTLAGILGPKLEELARLEGFNNGEELVKVIKSINERRLDQTALRFSTPLYTHYYEIVHCPDALRHFYGPRNEVCRDS
jgi:hypothetical protein